MITIKDLIDNTDFTEVQIGIEKYYQTKKMNDFESLYRRLKNLSPNKNKEKLTLSIQVFQNINNDVVYFPKYNEFDLENNSREVYFDVVGKDNVNEFYSIVFCRHQDFLGYFVENETLQKFTKESLIAHFLWEITFHGFDDERTL